MKLSRKIAIAKWINQSVAIVYAAHADAVVFRIRCLESLMK